jgi:predicted NAD-dependent protein-ADP-ribosyltransferase YbiA (DUF1768 family)
MSSLIVLYGPPITAHPLGLERTNRGGDVPWRALAKLESHADARVSLLAAGDEELMEASPHDAYWGSRPGGRGQNRYGQILMQVRAILRELENTQQKR